MVVAPIVSEQLTQQRLDALSKDELVVRAGHAAANLDTYTLRSFVEIQSLLDTLLVIKQAIDKIDVERRSFTDPLNGVVKSINAKYKAIATPLEDALVKGKNMCARARAHLEKKAADEAAEQRRLAAAAASAATGPTPPPAVVDAKPVDNVLRGGIAKSVGTKRLKVKMVDVKLVAEHYPHLLSLNEANAILEARAAIARGQGVINDDRGTMPGLEWWYDRGESLGRA